MADPEIEKKILEDLYTWIDQVPLSRPKRDLKRDFSDGVLVAEVVKHFVPNIVEMHNYSSALAVNKKLVNWQILNRKVFRKLGFEVNDDVVKNIVNCHPPAIEQFLLLLRKKIDQSSMQRAKSSQPEADQDRVLSHNVRIRKTSSNQPILHSQQLKSTVAKISESDTIFPVATTMSHKPVNSVPESFPGDGHLGVILQEKDEQLKSKDETIEILEAKIHRLEQLLQLKEIRIEDLLTRLNDSGAVKAVSKKKS